MQHLTRAIWALFSIVVHLCIGAGCYAFFVADLVDTSSALFWAWLGAWPIMLVVTFWGAVMKGLLWVVAVGVFILCVVWLVGFISMRRKAYLERINRGSGS